MHFSNPEMLWLLWLVLPLGLLLRIAAGRKTAALHRFADPELLDGLRPPRSPGRMLLRRILLMGGLIGIIVALAGPRWGFQWEDVERHGVDLVVALDLSRSMLAEDAKPDRLTAAKREIRDLIELLRGDRVALVAFAGTAFIQCPLTLDYHAFELFLDEMDPDWVPVGGTDLAGAVRTSIETFPKNERSGRAVLLITDGEDHSGELQAAAEEARKAGVHVFVVGMGDPQGAPIPDGRGGFVKEGGKVVLSRLDEAGLKELTLTTEGTFVRSVAGDLDLRRIYLDDIKGTLEARALAASRQRRWEERFQWALLPALLLLVLEGLTGPPRQREVRKAAAPVLAALALLLVPTPAMAWSLFGSDDPVRQGHDAFESEQFAEALDRWTEAQVDDPSDRRLDYNIGQALFRLERYPEAEEAFLAATATDVTGLAADAFYGAGNAAFQQGRYLDAIAAYEKSLELRPDDEDAVHNADLAQRRYEELMEQAEEQEQEQEPPPEEQDGESKEQGEEDQQGEEEQQEQEQQQGQAGKQEQDGEAENDGEKEESEEKQDEGQGQQEQEEQEQQEQAGGAAEAADVDRSAQPDEADSEPEGAVSSNTEEAERDDRPASVIEGALTEEQAEELLKALKADEQNRQKQRTEREARRGRKAAGKDW